MDIYVDMSKRGGNVMPWLMTEFADGVGGEEDARKAKTCSRFFSPRSCEKMLSCAILFGTTKNRIDE
eukprot:scaffold4452_cov255-Alexandrium_tamarense.AAC.1